MIHASSSSNLVVAAAWSYRIEIYRAFVISLRRTAGYSGDVQLLAPANRTHPDAAAFCEQWRVNVVDIASLGLGYKAGSVPKQMMGERAPTQKDSLFLTNLESNSGGDQ